MQLENELEQYHLFGENTPNWIVVILVMTGIFCGVATAILLADHSLQGIYQNSWEEWSNAKHDMAPVFESDVNRSAKPGVQNPDKKGDQLVTLKDQYRAGSLTTDQSQQTVVQDNSRLSQELAEAKAQLEEHAKENQRLEKEREEMEAKLSAELSKLADVGQEDTSGLSLELAEAKVQLERYAEENRRWERERQEIKEKLSVDQSKLSAVEQDISRLSQGLAEANMELEKYLGAYQLAEKEKQELEMKLSSRNTIPDALEMDQQTQSAQGLTNVEQNPGKEVLKESGSTPETQKRGMTNTPARPVLQDCPPIISITFEYSDVQPTTTAQTGMIEQLGGWLQSHPDARALVEGHTDSTGTDEYNLLLSYRRARIVSDMLAKEGVAEKQLTIQAFGEHSPLAGIPDTSKKNRRVSLRVKGKQGCIEHLSSGDAS